MKNDFELLAHRPTANKINFLYAYLGRQGGKEGIVALGDTEASMKPLVFGDQNVAIKAGKLVQEMRDATDTEINLVKFMRVEE